MADPAQKIKINDNAAYLNRLLTSMKHSFSVYETVKSACIAGMAWTLIGLIAIWADMYIHLPALWRWIFFLSIAGISLIALWWLVFAVLISPAGERWLSVQVERRNPSLKNRLITATQILRGGHETQDFDPEFCQRILAQTAEILRDMDLKPIVPWRKMRNLTAVIIILSLCAIVLRQQWPEGFDAALSRLIFPYADIPVPSLTKIAVIPEGAIVPRGDNLRIQAIIKGKTTDKVSLHLRRPDKDWTIISMLPEVKTTNNIVTPNSFYYEITTINEALEYFISAGDGETKIFKINVVERPNIKSIQISYKYPDYLGIEPRQMEKGICTIEAPVGTFVEIAAETDLPVNGGQLRLVLQGNPNPVFIPLTLENPLSLLTHFTLEKSGIYSVLVTNAAGLGEKKPLEYPIIVQIDTPPIVEVLEPGRDIVIDDVQTIPVLASARDDFGLSAMYVWISISNTPSITTNNGKFLPPGRKLLDITEPSVKNQNAALQIQCDKIEDFKEKGKIIYSVFAIDRKGQVGNSREYTVMLTEAFKKRMLEEKITNTIPAAEEKETQKKPLPPEVAQIQALIEKQRTITEKLLKTREEAQKFRPSQEILAREIRTSFDQQKKFAKDLLESKSWAQTKLDEIAKNPVAQNPQFERTLRMMRDMMDSLREEEVKNAMAALREAFLTIAPAGTNLSLAGSTQTSAQQSQGNQTQPDAGQQSGQEQQNVSSPTSSQESPVPSAPQLLHKKLTGNDKNQVRQQINESIKNQNEIINKLEALKQRMEASLPGKLDQATIDALDKATMEELAEDTQDFKKGLQLASQKAQKAAEVLKPLVEKQTDLKTKTIQTESEKIPNLAKPQDKLKLETGHAEERLAQEIPWLKPLNDLPQEIQDSVMSASTAPNVPIPQVPSAPRKEALQGDDAQMPQVFQQSGDHPMPKLLVPDKFPDTFRGNLSDKPIPAPPPGAVPTGKAPKTSLRKMTQEEKEKLRKETMLDSLELLDDGMAMGLGAPDAEEMPEEMLLEPGAQYSSGPSAPDSKPGMELGQSAGKVLGNPLQPPAGGGGGGGEDQGSAKPPSQSVPSSNSEGQKPSQSRSGGTGKTGGGGNQSLSQIDRGETPSSRGGTVSAAVSAMNVASSALASGDRANAVTAQNTAIATLTDRKVQLERISAFARELSDQFNSLQAMLARDDLQRAEALNEIEQALRSPAWNILNEPLSQSAEVQLLGLRNRLRKTYELLGGNISSIPKIGIENKADVVDWAKFTLPPHLKQELLDGLKENAPPAYQQIPVSYTHLTLPTIYSV